MYDEFWFEDEAKVLEVAHWLVNNDKLEQPDSKNKFTAFDNGAIAVLYYFENPKKWTPEYQEMVEEEGVEYGGFSDHGAGDAMNRARALK